MRGSPLLNRIEDDQRVVAERRWRSRLKPKADQLPCDVGLFSDDRDQLDLVEMFMDPVNE
jgi:hypothetical protein